MSTGARFQFIHIDPLDQVRMAAWTHHISRLTGAPADDSADPSDVVILWHLAAGNHRVLARSAASFSSVESAWRDIERVLAARLALTPRMVRLESNRGYGWVLLNDGAPAVTCARWYAMERDRRESLRSARAALDSLASNPHRAAEELSVPEGEPA